MRARSRSGLSTVLVHQGAPGGIGQIERLLNRAFSSVADRLLTLRRRPVPTVVDNGVAERLESNVRFGARVLRKVAAMQPDLVVLTHLNFAPLALPVRMAAPSSRIVCVAYGIEAWSPLGPSIQLAIRAVDAIWCISEFTKGMLIRESAVSNSKVRVLLLGLAQDRARTIEAYEHDAGVRGPNTFGMLSVSRLDPTERYKGIEHTLISLAQVRVAHPTVRYRLIGDGADRAALQDLARVLGISDIVDAEGASYDDDVVARALNDCDVFVLPSAKEGFGLAHLEAMCASKPVIAANAGASPEVVDGASGILTRYGDCEGLSHSLIRLINDPGLCAALGANARSTYTRMFTEDAFQTRLCQLLETM